MMKAGNRYLRYYLIQAAGSVVRYCPEYTDYYNKKFAEVPKHQHKRALALTARKLIRLIFGLLDKNQLYSPARVGNRIPNFFLAVLSQAYLLYPFLSVFIEIFFYHLLTYHQIAIPSVLYFILYFLFCLLSMSSYHISPFFSLCIRAMYIRS